MEAWYLVGTKLKCELKVKQNLFHKYGLMSFFPVFPPKKAKSAIGLPLFPRYVFVRCDLERDFQKIQYTPGVTKMVCFGAVYPPIPDEVIHCLQARCDEHDQIMSLPVVKEEVPVFEKGQVVRIKEGLFEGCQGIIQEKRGNRRVQLLLEMAYGPLVKVEVANQDVEPQQE